MTLFKPELVAEILAGRKTQTRRTVKPGETAEYDAAGRIVRVRFANGRTKWQVGQTYSVQPGYGQRGVAYYRLKALRLDPDVRNISAADAYEEGFQSRHDFFLTWLELCDPAAYKVYSGYDLPLGTARDYLATRPAHRYTAWVKEFELVR